MNSAGKLHILRSKVIQPGRNNFELPEKQECILPPPPPWNCQDKAASSQTQAHRRGERGNIKQGAMVTSPNYDAHNRFWMVTAGVTTWRHWDNVCNFPICYHLVYWFSIAPRITLPRQAKSEPLFIFIVLAITCQPHLAFRGLGLQVGKIAPQPDRGTVAQGSQFGKSTFHCKAIWH